MCFGKSPSVLRTTRSDRSLSSSGGQRESTFVVEGMAYVRLQCRLSGSPECQSNAILPCCHRSIILHVACSLLHMAKNPQSDGTNPVFISPKLCMRILLSSLFEMGILCSALILDTPRQYGPAMDHT
ncbi:LOW QUALITY PROTEIN: hypothetical protein CVT26_015300 [Gymnopilus dilepis]|uniref:Uncharacterized protein n=1 Tax=Gymnopilus dilepis TaxID=231916 RepID=A0A409YE11_9AGAR|nr:LOW QUALITY PROTEIN: hypothetical protein CVT26_015300 [Gymnopilus dilepis]